MIWWRAVDAVLEGMTQTAVAAAYGDCSQDVQYVGQRVGEDLIDRAEASESGEVSRFCGEDEDAVRGACSAQ